MSLKLFLTAADPAAPLPDEQTLADGIAEQWPDVHQSSDDYLGRHVRRFYFDLHGTHGLEATYHAGADPMLVVDLSAARTQVVRLAEWLRAQVPGQRLRAILQIADEADVHELASAADLEQVLDHPDLY